MSNWDTSKVTNMTWMFYDCSRLTSLDLSNRDTSNVTTMNGTFYNCSSLESLNLSNWDTTNMIDMAGMFYGCRNLTSLDVSDWDVSNVTGMNAVFYGCSGFTKVTIPNSIMSIGDCSFWGNNLSSIILPDNISYIGINAFDRVGSIVHYAVSPIHYDDNSNSLILSSIKLYTNRGTTTLLSLWNRHYTAYDIKTNRTLSPTTITLISTTQTTATYKVENFYPEYEYKYGNTYDYYGFYGIDELNPLIGTEFTLRGFRPNEIGSAYLHIGSYIDGYFNSICCVSADFITQSIIPSVSINSATASSALITGSHIEGDAHITAQSLTVNGVEINGNKYIATGLDPQTTLTAMHTITVSYGKNLEHTYNYVSSKETITTEALTLTTQQPKVISAGNAIVSAQANVNEAETNVGFEWRRTDWTNEFASNTGSAYVYDGMMEGYIRNLYTEKLWKFRPYYESASGNRYYGEWVGLDPTNTSYFEPTVHTYAQVNVNGNAAEVKGIAQRGTDNITAQGFVYWTDSQEAKVRKAVGVQEDDIPETAMTVTAKGQVMTTTLKGLRYDTDYCYTAFVTTSEGETFYGEKQTFRTGINPACDLNGDGKCTVDDVAMLLKVYLGKASSDRGDLDGDGSVTVSDITQLIEMYRQTKK